MKFCWWLAISATALLGQEFEAASVKLLNNNPAGLPVMRGGPGSKDPGRIHYSPVTLMQLVTKAFNVYGDQVFAPRWLTTELYAVDAILPDNTSPEQFEAMLQHLLIERFQLAFHRDEKEFTVYDLVQTDGGAKLRPAMNAEEGADDAPITPTQFDDQVCPVVHSTRRTAVAHITAGNECTSFRAYSMADIANAVGIMVAVENGSHFGPQAPAAHIADKTGLLGRFDFELQYNLTARVPGSMAGTEPDAAEPAGGPMLAEALKKQLGLKLIKSNARLTTIVIDRIVKVPTEN